METCEHGSRISQFCIYEHCASKQSGGCQICMKKYHSHVGSPNLINSQQLQQLIRKFTIESSVKPKCRPFQENIFRFFTLIKKQIAQTIDLACKGTVNRLGYPYLSNVNHLLSYKKIKNKDYSKITAKQLRKFYLECINSESNVINIKQKDLYTQQIIESFNLVSNLENIMKEYEKCIQIFCTNFKHDSSIFKSIEELKTYLDKPKLTQRELDKYSVFYSTNKYQPEKKSKIQAKVERKSSQKQLKTQFIRGESQNQQFHELKIKKQSQNLSSQKRTEQKQVSGVKNEKLADYSHRQKYKHSRNYSYDKESVKNEELFLQTQYYDNDRKIEQKSQQKRTVGQINLQNYQSKQRQILQRKQKLIRMMNVKAKSTVKQFGYIFKISPPPLLTFQVSSLQKDHKDIHNKFSETIDQSLSNGHYYEIDAQKKMRKNSKLPIPTNKLSLSNSTNSFHSFIKGNANQISNDEINTKYKYAVARLPSCESQENFNFSAVNKSVSQRFQTSPQKIKNSRFSAIRRKQSSPKVQTGGLNLTQSQEKSSCLYFKALTLKSKDSIQYLKAALIYSPMNISAAEYLSFIYLKQNKAKQCLNLCNQYLNRINSCKSQSQKTRFLNNKAASLNILGRYSQTITLLQAQIHKYEEPKMFKNLADAYLSIGILEKCQYNYEKAIKLDTSYDQAMYNLSVLLYFQGSYHNAKIWIEKALQIDCKDNQYTLLNIQVNKRLEKVNQPNIFTFK